MSSQKEIDEFVASATAEAEEKKLAYMDEHDMKTFIKWPIGASTKFTLQRKLPRDHESFGNPAKVFRIEIDGEEFDWSVNPTSPMFMQVIAVLGKSPLDGTITRLGEGLQTRYGLIWESEDSLEGS